MSEDNVVRGELAAKARATGCSNVVVLTATRASSFCSLISILARFMGEDEWQG